MSDVQLHFQNVRAIIRQGKTRALQAATAYSLAAYWNVGAYLSQRLTENTYGKKVVGQLAEWLQQQEPGLKGFDQRSLYRMREFFEQWQAVDWSEFGISGKIGFQDVSATEQSNEILVTLSPKSVNELKNEIVGSTIPQLSGIPIILTKVSWSQHIDLLSGCTSIEERLFYLVLAIKDRYTVRELRRQIKSSLYERQMLAKHTMLIPEHPKKELFPELFRDRYLLEFLEISEPYSEYDLRKALIRRMKDFLLELGRDFLFLDEEMHLKVGMNDYFVDLVFFHRELECLVAFDLKIEEFRPEHLGKMNFYLELLDRDVRKPHENPSIGVVLCKSKNDEVVEIAMSRQLTPALVAVYETKFLDKTLLRRLLHEWAEEWEQNKKF
jgi:predicted nuclease of restriction endonuclease-like (RecB) superfamily